MDLTATRWSPCGHESPRPQRLEPSSVQNFRTARSITQENLAVDAGVDRTTISGLERGDFNAPVDLIERIANALGADVIDLLAVPRADSTEPAPLRAGRKSKGSGRQAVAIGIGGGRYDRAPATPPGMRVRTGRFEELRSGEAADTEGIHPPEG
ncbi:helix-turn-helix transcriptional regulator [Sinorhizobium meliloti]|uniref:helix-turn-helix transcriptional regulator n=1 Tax=Rhizobium meliloti TaxID=382 RepID=UPI003D64673C